MRGGRASWLRTGVERTRNFKWPVIKKKMGIANQAHVAKSCSLVCVFFIYSAGLVCARVWTVVGHCNL